MDDFGNLLSPRNGNYSWECLEQSFGSGCTYCFGAWHIHGYWTYWL